MNIDMSQPFFFYLARFKFKINKKSATTSRAWSQPLPAAFLIPPALLVVAD
jgi:hypothetical protein